MLLPKFSFHEPADLAELCNVLVELGPEAELLAGGTDLIVNMKKKMAHPAHVVWLGRVPELKGLQVQEEEVEIGSGVTAAQLAQEPAIRAFSALVQGGRSLGTPLIRNLATLGGNLITARPAADLPPPLMVYGAQVVLKSRERERRMDLDRFFEGPGSTRREPDEVLARVVFKKPSGPSGSRYIKLGVRETLEISLVNVGVFLELDPEQKAIQEARVVLGAVAPTPIRAPSAEARLRGEAPSPKLFEEAARAAVSDSRPIDDFRASAEYRREMVRVLTQRALHGAWAEAVGAA